MPWAGDKEGAQVGLGDPGELFQPGPSRVSPECHRGQTGILEFQGGWGGKEELQGWAEWDLGTQTGNLGSCAGSRVGP